MKHLTFGVLAAGASFLLTSGAMVPTAQAEPDIDVTCEHTMAIEGRIPNYWITAHDCQGAPVGLRDQGRVTLQDRGPTTFWCDDILVGHGGEGPSVRARGCYPVLPD